MAGGAAVDRDQRNKPAWEERSALDLWAGCHTARASSPQIAATCQIVMVLSIDDGDDEDNNNNHHSPPRPSKQKNIKACCHMASVVAS